MQAESSQALQRCFDEVDRLWKAAEQLDGKVVAVLGFAVPVALGTTGVLSGHLVPLETSRSTWWWLGVLLALGLVGLAGFVWMALRVILGYRFAGPIDPARIAENPAYLEEHERFEADALPIVAQAFGECVKAYEKKWKWFMRSLVCLALSVCLLVSAGVIVIIQERAMAGNKDAERARRSASSRVDHKSSTGRSVDSTKNTQEAGKEARKSPLGYYVIQKSLVDSERNRKSR